MSLAFEILIGLGVVALIALQFRRNTSGPVSNEDAIRLRSELDQKTKEIGTIQNMLEKEKAEGQERQGKSKQLFTQFTQLEAKLESLQKERDALKKEVTRFEAEQHQREREFQVMLTQLDKAQEALKEERQRVIKEEEQEREHEREERDRLWAEHEKNVIAQLMGLCKMPQLGFAHFTNTNLPEEFDGSLKPDFMIEFLDQYVIFDAKVSKAESLQTYINNAVKMTTQKVKKNAKIASMIYLVVPTEAISELKNFVYPVDGYTIYVVSPEALPSILASMKKITTYEFADQMDPQQRENIVQTLAELDFHINLQNAANIIMTKRGTEILERAQHVDPELAADVALKKQPMNAKATLAATELKKIVSSLMEQNLEVDKLVAPRASVKKKDLKSAETVIMDSLL